MAQLTPTEQRALFAQGFKKRMGNLAGVGDRIATDVPKIASGLVKEEIFGLPGLVGDLIVPAMSATGPLALDPAAQQASEKFQEEFGASGLAQKAGVELSDEFLDAEGNVRPEMIGRLLAPGALYAKTAGLAGLFKQAVTKTKARGSGIEKKGTGTAQLDSSPSDLEPSDEIMDYVRRQQTPDAIKDLVSPDASESATYFLQDARKSDELLDTVSPDTLSAIQGKLKEDSNIFVADHLGIKVEDLTPDTPVTVYRVGDIKEGEVQSFSLDSNIGRQTLPGQSLRERQGKTTQATNKYTVRAGDILASPESTVPGISSLNEKEILIDGSSVKSVAPKKDVLEGEVVGGKSDKYTKLQKQADEARTSELSDAKTLQMEIQGVTDAFDVAAAKKLDATFEMIGRQMGEDAPYTSKDFTDNVIDEFEGAIDQGMSRADALIDAVRVTTDNYNRTFNADLFNTEDILSDLSKGINEDFGFDAALDARRAGQANRAALEQQLKNAESVTRRADAAASQAELERLAGVTDDMTPDEVFQAISSYVGKDQAGISGAGIPQPKRPQLRVISDNTPVKKAAGGKVDLRSGIGNVFKLYS
jgi:hypothetical protein